MLHEAKAIASLVLIDLGAHRAYCDCSFGFEVGELAGRLEIAVDLLMTLSDLGQEPGSTFGL